MKQETLEEVAEIILLENTKNTEIRYRGNRGMVIKSMLDIAKWQQEQIGKSEFLQKLRGTLSNAEARRLIFEKFKKFKDYESKKSI